MKKLYPTISFVVATFSLITIIGNFTTFAHEIPKAECKESTWNGRVACGYNCVESTWHGRVACADWVGGVCKESSWNGQITCGPPAPPDWLSRHASQSNRTRSGIYGAWAVQNGLWNGILRMQGKSGRMVLTTNTGASVEQKMTLKANLEGGYILDGEVLSSYVRGKYYADNFYIQQFFKDSMSIKNCDEKKNCNFITLVYLGE